MRCIFDIKRLVCTGADCQIVLAGNIHFHCPYCNALFTFDFTSWNHLIKRPKVCKWCKHKIDYGKRFEEDKYIAEESVKEYIKLYNKRKEEKNSKYLSSVHFPTYDEAATNGGYHNNGYLNDANYGSTYLTNL